MNKPEDVLYGVGCDVSDCKYNSTEEKLCHADFINVENKAAHSMAETYCGTFEPKANS